MVLQPVQRRPKRYIEVAEQLRTLIQRGEFAPGTKLPSERQLGQRFGVGRSSVREALTALQSIGLIEIRQGVGARVLASTTDALDTWQRGEFHSEQEMLEARGVIERCNAQLAARRATRADLARLAGLLSEMEAVDGRGEPGDHLDLQFHLALAEATHNGVLIELTRTLSARVGPALAWVRAKLVQQPMNRQHLLDQHRRIFRTIAAGDEGAAAHTMETHLQFVQHELERFYTATPEPYVAGEKEANHTSPAP